MVIMYFQYEIIVSAFLSGADPAALLTYLIYNIKLYKLHDVKSFDMGF